MLINKFFIGNIIKLFIYSIYKKMFKNLIKIPYLYFITIRTYISF